MRKLLVLMAAAATLQCAWVAPDTAASQTAGSAASPQVGPLANGGYLLNSGWRLQPAGAQITVGAFPMSMAISSDRKFLLILNAGLPPPTISVIDIETQKEVSRTTLADAWLGLTAMTSGNLIYVGGGSTGKVFELSLAPDGKLTKTREFPVAPSKAKGAPFVGDVALSPDGRVLYAADLYGASIAQINLQSGKMVDHWRTGRRPYRILVSPDGAQLLISSWAEGVIYVHESGTGINTAKLRVGAHPTDMLWINKPVIEEDGTTKYVGRVFVTASNTNSVFSFGVSRDGQLTMIEPINVSLSPVHPLGMTPSALAADGRGTRLYATCSDANAVAVVDISTRPSRTLGFVPTGWYPTAVRVLNDRELSVANGRGSGQSPKASPPNLQPGSVSMLPLPKQDELVSLTETVMAASPFKEDLIYGPPADAAQAFFARSQGHASPIQHVIYVIKGDASFDGVLGDLPKGNVDRSLLRFGEAVTPNLHKLAREFVLYDNFYSNGDSSADGQNWAVAAIAPDYTEKLWQSERAGRSKVYDFEGGELANTPPAGYLWSNALQAGITVRNYGEWVTNLAGPPAAGQPQVQVTGEPSLLNHTDLDYRGADPAYKDTDRAGEFISEWKDFEEKGDAPQLSIVRLSNDAPPGGGTAASTAAVLDNDQALGALADAVSHSKLWSSTAIVVIEQSANGPDHVDPQRSPAFVISPYTRRETVDSNIYNEIGALRTVELILGLRPMTHFDGGATPLFGSFSRQPDLTPFTAAPLGSQPPAVK